MKKMKKYAERVNALAHKMMSHGIAATLKEEFANAHGSVTLSRLAFEAIGALILVIILLLVPRLGSTIEEGLPDLPAESAWGNFSGSGLWGQLEPMFTVAAIVIIIGMVIRVIYGLKNTE